MGQTEQNKHGWEDIYWNEGFHQRTKFPKHNMFKEADKYFIELAIAGWSKNDIGIEIEDCTLVITGDEVQKEGREYLDRELTFQKFEKKFVLDDLIDIENIQSVYIDGILTITLPVLEKALPKVKIVSIQ